MSYGYDYNNAVSPASTGGYGSTAVSPASTGGYGGTAVSPASTGGYGSTAVSPASTGGYGSNMVSPASTGGYPGYNYNYPYQPSTQTMPGSGQMQMPMTAGQMQMPMMPMTAGQMQMPMAPMTAQMQMASAPTTPNVPSGSIVTPAGGNIITVPINEESYVENIIRMNRGKMATIYMTYENNSEWNAKIFKGIIEAAGRDHIIISDPATGMRYLLLTLNLDYVTFDGPINYAYTFQGQTITNTTPATATRIETSSGTLTGDR
ncbi:spore coat protein GerQ [Paenibacillus sepulcri]